jgi:molybdate transport system substrate-binding protein
MVESGAADAGIIALSLALFPTMAEHGHYLIDDALHEPLTQGFVVTQRAADNPTARAFVHFMHTPETRAIMERYGFVLPPTP